MTYAYTRASQLGFNSRISLNGQTVVVRAVRPAQLPYRGASFPVIYVTGRSPETGKVTHHTLLAEQELIAAR